MQRHLLYQIGGGGRTSVDVYPRTMRDQFESFSRRGICQFCHCCNVKKTIDLMSMILIKLKKALQLGGPFWFLNKKCYLLLIPPQTDIHTNFKKELGAFGASGFWRNNVYASVGCFKLTYISSFSFEITSSNSSEIVNNGFIVHVLVTPSQG